MFRKGDYVYTDRNQWSGDGETGIVISERDPGSHHVYIGFDKGWPHRRLYILRKFVHHIEERDPSIMEQDII